MRVRGMQGRFRRPGHPAYNASWPDGLWRELWKRIWIKDGECSHWL